MLNHLKGCSHVSQVIQERASAESNDRKDRSPVKLSRIAPSIPGISTPIPFLTFIAPGGFAPVASSAANWANSHAQLVVSTSHSPAASDVFSVDSAIGPGDSISQAPSLSRQPSVIDFGSDVSRSKRRRTAYEQYSPTPLWSDAMQAHFEYRLARLTASANLPMAWVDNPEFSLLCQEFIHQDAIPPRRGPLTRRIIPTTLKSMQSEVRGKVEGKSGTLQCDGWTGINFVHLIAFMLAVEQLALCVFMMHQQGFLKYSKEASELIAWLRSKSYVLALIRKTQLENGLRVLAIIRAVLTRWTAHYLAFSCLLEVAGTLRILANQENGPTIQGLPDYNW
jgi:hypothetical protein